MARRSRLGVLSDRRAVKTLLYEKNRGMRKSRIEELLPNIKPQHIAKILTELRLSDEIVLFMHKYWMPRHSGEYKIVVDTTMNELIIEGEVSK